MIALSLLALIPTASAAEIDQRLDRLVFSIHVDVASELDLDELRSHLELVRVWFHSSLGPDDVSCCTGIEAVELEIFGTPGDGLDIIDSQSKWDQLGTRKALVYDITWPQPTAGRAQIGGERIAVALCCANIPYVIAHERLHNAGLSHSGPLTFMSGGSSWMTVEECDAFRGLGSPDGICSCMGPTVGDPPLPDTSVCSFDGNAGYCKDGGLCIEGAVFPHLKISDEEGGFGGTLGDGDWFGLSVASLGDLDSDGVGDLATGALGDDGGGSGRGAVWILLLKPDGTVKSQRKISHMQGGFTGQLDDGDEFGEAVASLGDLDGDGVGDLAVGAWRDDDGGEDRGAVWILFLNADGTVWSHQKISATQGGFAGRIDDSDWFGASAASLGDLDGDGVGDLAVGAWGDDDGGDHRGAVWILFLNADGTVKSQQKISDTQGQFSGILDDRDGFGLSATSLGDLDGDGAGDLAVGAVGDDDEGEQRGAVWILFLDNDGTVKSHQKISATQGGFSGLLDDHDWFGSSLAFLGGLDKDGAAELAVGAYRDDDGGRGRGAVWILSLDSSGAVRSHEKISHTKGGFAGRLLDDDGFGISVAALRSLGNRRSGDLLVGAWMDDDGGEDRGSVWILFTPAPRSGLLLLVGLGAVILLARRRKWTE